MGGQQGYSKVTTSGLVFAYDTGDQRNSYAGEPTTNLANFNVASSTFNTDTSGNLSQTANSSEATYRGRLSRKMVVGAGYWNAYIYDYNTGVSSTKFAVSYKVKTANGAHPSTIIGGGYIYGSAGSFFPAPTFTYLNDGWYLATMLYSGTSMVLNSLTGMNGSGPGVFYIIDYQAEAKDHSTPFAGVAGTRSNTQGLLDISGGGTSINLANVSFDSNAQYYFDGTDDKIDISYASAVDNSMSRTWEVVVKPTATMTYAGIFGNKISTGCSYHCNGGIYLWDGNWVFDWYDNSSYQFLYSYVSPTANQTFHIVGTYDASDQKPRIYVNGVLKATYGSATNMNYGGATYIIDAGWNSGGYHYFQGYLPVAKYHQNKALSANEVLQNYNHYKTRFNIT
jgi:hypothetical protein